MDRVELEQLLRQIRVEKREEDASTECKRSGRSPERRRRRCP